MKDDIRKRINWYLRTETPGHSNATEETEETGAVLELLKTAILLIPGATAVGTLGLGLGAMLLGQPWFWVVFVVGFLVFLPAATIFAKLLIDSLGGQADAESVDQEVITDPLEYLQSRYVRGELDEEEFERHLSVLAEANGTVGSDGETEQEESEQPVLNK